MTDENATNVRVETRKLIINFDEISALAKTGVCRASTFLKLGLVGCDHPPEKYELGGGICYRFMADPSTPELRAQIDQEYRAWIASCGLKELDHCFSLFLDRVWFVIELISLHGTRVHSSYCFDAKFQQDTNAGKKLKAVADALSIQIEIDCFRSLSLARNSLSHGAGIVRERDTNAGRALEISWVAPVMVVLDGDNEIVYRSEPADMYRVKSENGAEILLRFDLQKKIFREGERIVLTPHELAEICAFYDIAASKVIEGLKTAVKAKGITGDVPNAA